MKKILLSSLLVTSIFAFAYTQNDVGNANYLANKSIITKQSDETKYRLNDTITRAEVVAITLKIKGIKDPSSYKCKKYYSDTVQNDWVCRAVEIAADNSLVSRGNKKFRPQEKITKAEALAILMNAGGIEYTKSAQEFYPEIPQWIVDLLEGAMNLGITGTYPNPSEYMVQFATRAQVFEFAKNILEYKAKMASGEFNI